MRRRHGAGPLVCSSAYRELCGYSIPAKQLTGRISTVLACARNSPPHRRESRFLWVGKAFQPNRFRQASVTIAETEHGKAEHPIKIVTPTAPFEAVMPDLGQFSAKAAQCFAFRQLCNPVMSISARRPLSEIAAAQLNAQTNCPARRRTRISDLSARRRSSATNSPQWCAPPVLIRGPLCAGR